MISEGKLKVRYFEFEIYSEMEYLFESASNNFPILPSLLRLSLASSSPTWQEASTVLGSLSISLSSVGLLWLGPVIID